LLQHTVLQAAAKLGGLVEKTRAEVAKTEDLRVASRSYESLRVVQQMLSVSFGSTYSPAPPQAHATLARLKINVTEIAAQILLQLEGVKQKGEEEGDSLLLVAKTLRSIITAIHVEPPQR